MIIAGKPAMGLPVVTRDTGHPLLASALKTCFTRKWSREGEASCRRCLRRPLRKGLQDLDPAANTSMVLPLFWQ